MMETISKLLKMFKHHITEDGYKIRPSYHVTALFIGGDHNKEESPVYKNFEVGKRVDIPVRALIFVPG